MGIEFRDILRGILLTSLLVNLAAEKFYLKNGQVIEGKLISEDERFVRIKISVGETKLEQEQILKIESDSSQSDKDVNNILSVSELIAAGEDSVKAGNKHDAIIYFKKAWEKTGKKDQKIRERFWKLEQEFSEEIIREINALIEQEKFRSAAASLEENLRIFRKRPKVALTLKKIKNDLYKKFMNDEDALDYFSQVLDKWSYLNTSQSGDKKTGRRVVKESSKKRKSRNKDRGRNKKNAESDTSYNSFIKQAELLEPRYSNLIQSVVPLYSFSRFIRDNEFAHYAALNLYSKKELDAARGNRETFRSMCADNDRIYKSRSACKQFNVALLKARNEYKFISEQIRIENEKWLDQGYEKIGGEWLKGNDLKKAKGLVYYHGQWLDPNSSDFDKKVAQIDKSLADSIKEENEKKKLIEIEQKRLAEEAEQEKKKEEEASVEGSSEIEVQQKKLSDSIQKAFTPKDNQNVNTEKKKVNITKNTDEDDSDVSEDSEEKGLPTPVGVGILLLLGFILYLNKKGNKK